MNGISESERSEDDYFNTDSIQWSMKLAILWLLSGMRLAKPFTNGGQILEVSF